MHTIEQGTLPFMAVELLCAVGDIPAQHTATHDLESLVYLLCWIVSSTPVRIASFARTRPNWSWRSGITVIILTHVHTAKKVG